MMLMTGDEDAELVVHYIARMVLLSERLISTYCSGYVVYMPVLMLGTTLLCNVQNYELSCRV